MRDLDMLDVYRRRDLEMRGYGHEGNSGNGLFIIPSPEDGEPLRIIAATGGGWEHVSVSRDDRCPTWGEMDFIARTFFQAHEWAMQLHVPPGDHINEHPHCLHVWRPTGGKPIPRPPKIFVG
jgi:hypothetical protein